MRGVRVPVAKNKHELVSEGEYSEKLCRYHGLFSQPRVDRQAATRHDLAWVRTDVRSEPTWLRLKSRRRVTPEVREANFDVEKMSGTRVCAIARCGLGYLDTLVGDA